MIPRMTTVGVLNNYRYDLNKSNNTMTRAMNTVMTGRSFFSYADDPAMATRCFQMRRSFMRTASQLDVNTSVLSKYNQAWACLDTVSQDIYDSTVTQNSTAFGSLLRSENEADASGRNALGQSLSALAQSIVQTMNGRNGENYLFAGADTLNAPFAWEVRKNPAYVDPEDIEADPDSYPEVFKYLADPDNPANNGAKYTNDESLAAYTKVENPFPDPEIPDWYEVPAEDGKITGKYLTKDSVQKSEMVYDEESGETALVTYFTNTTDEDPNEGEEEALTAIQKNDAYDETAQYQYKYLKPDGTGTNNEAEAAQDLYFRGVPVDSNYYKENMEYFLSETKYLDVGLGHKEQDSEALSSTVFNSALQGIYYLGGYGTDENGIPNNLISIINELGTILQRCDPDNGAYASDEDAERAEALAHKLEDQQEVFIQRYAEIDTRSSFLRDNGELLTDTADSLAQQFLGLEDVDPADAISAYMYARYCYDAALKLGNSVLPQSLMDYMNF